MNLFKLFSKPEDNALNKNIENENATGYKNFGRFSDSLTEPNQVKLFDEALKKFETNDYIANYKLFLQFLTNKKDDNVLISETASGINFEIIQGSKKITGLATVQKFYCVSKIAQVDTLQVRYLRQMIEANFAFMYIRFAIDPDNNIVLLFESVASEASPYKLLEALRELAIYADKNDDLLLSEFKDDLKPLDLGLRKELPSNTRNFYAHYLIQEIEQTFAYLLQNPILETQYMGGVAYLWLSLAYQLDYLLAPQGYINDSIERIERLFFEKPLDLGLRKELPSNTRNFYAHYLIQEIEQTFAYLLQNPILETQYMGGVAYLWLSLAYQLDYLLAPQGYINDSIERIERLFFEKSTESYSIKNKKIADEFLNIKERRLDLILDELYQTTCTFSIMSVKTIRELANLIDSELPNMNWYAKNNYQKIAFAVTDFIVGNAQFNNSFPDFERQLLHLYMQVRHFDFFKQLGLNSNFKNAAGILNTKEIKNALQAILVENNIAKKQIEICITTLNCTDEVSWARSYLEMITLLNG